MIILCSAVFTCPAGRAHASDESECCDISDMPLDALTRGVGAIVMFVLDDSGSMDWEFMTEEDDGVFSGESVEYYYVFDDPGDNIYTSYYSWYNDYILKDSDRDLWRSQWAGYNRIYYNPEIDYTPWPTLPDADPSTPRSHPYHASPTFDLSAVYCTLDGEEIPRAHYYTVNDLDGDGEVDSGEDIYLVCLQSGASSIDYYLVEEDSDGEAVHLTPKNADEVPDALRPKNPDGSFRTYEEERQNFANWYSFYRRRELTAIAAISRTLYELDSAYVGFRSINGDIKQPVLPVKVGGQDERPTLLEALYSHEGEMRGTPLRRGLESVGQYLDQEDSSNGDMGYGVTSPWNDQGEGGECQQAFSIVMTDGYYNGSSPYVGNVDGDKGPPYSDDYSNTLADVAMLYYEKDLASALEDQVPPNPYDEAVHQHMVTYTVSFGVKGTLNPDDYDLTAEDYPSWPNPFDGSSEKIDDLWHAAVNGRGEYLSANDPESLVKALLSIMQNIASRTGSASSVSINGDELYNMVGDEVRMFQASYSSATMTGDVKSYRIDQYTGDVLMDEPVWAAAEKLDQRVAIDGHQDRIIVTYNPDEGSGLPFTYSDLSSGGTDEQLSDLAPDWSSSSTATTENLINYIRGDKTYELINSGPFRDRSSLLGDIVNSSPLFHRGALYAGGNDGMLHVFDAATGRELFAYIPNLVYDHISDLGDPAYTHKFYVDLTPYIMDGVEVQGVEKSLLVGGLGKGGKGYYALDVTGITGEAGFAGETSAGVADRVMWEYPKTDTPSDEMDDLGYSFSRAIIAESNDTTGAPWVVIFGNGYNSANSSAVLFILDPADGSLIKRLDTGVTGCNGLSTPVLVDEDFDDKVDYAYAGDLQGNLWKFDLSSDNFNEWGVAYGVDNDLDGSINSDDGDSPAPLFRAKGPSGSPQPITTTPDVMSHCERHGYIVTFGTGKYLGESDLLDTSTQTVYGIWDYGDDEDDSEYLGSFERGSTPELSNQLESVTLLQQDASDHRLTVNIDTDGDGEPDGVEDMTFRVLTYNPADWSITNTPDGGVSCGDFSSDEPCDPSPPGTQPDPLAHAGWYFD
ncbi:MAG: pilus assembly protein, partial [Actinomycetota bacterium]